MDISLDGIKLKGIESINVVLGKNGVGKSLLLRDIDTKFSQDKENYLVKYISPERGGELTFQSAVEQNVRNEKWAIGQRRRNRVSEFRSMSHSQYRALETLVLRKRERDADAPSFDDIVAKINELLDHVELVRGATTDMEFRNKESGKPQNADTLSSGESELLSLASEILAYCYQAEHRDNAGKTKFLLIDEPDVHLHPDLQHRLVRLIASSCDGKEIIVLMATHSTALLGALDGASASVAFMTKGVVELQFEPISEQLRNVIPIFGAHPLTNVFSESPILLVEGESDFRIWQQAVRSSNGRIRVWPCAAGDIQSLNNYEQIAAKIIASVYDNAKAYSIRDRDDQQYEIVDLENVTRMRLKCRAVENLILADDVLELAGTNWDDFKHGVADWLKVNTHHKQFEQMDAFANGFDRVGTNVKDLRNIFMAIAGSAKPWEVVVGQAIAALNNQSSQEEGSLALFLGPRATAALQLLAEW